MAQTGKSIFIDMEGYATKATAKFNAVLEKEMHKMAERNLVGKTIIYKSSGKRGVGQIVPDGTRGKITKVQIKHVSCEKQLQGVSIMVTWEGDHPNKNYAFYELLTAFANSEIQ